jgi:hypothetical protein
MKTRDLFVEGRKIVSMGTLLSVDLPVLMEKQRKLALALAM